MELKYNLIPWKTGWQTLPVLQLEFNREYCLPEDEQLQSDLKHLVKRWMPKAVFVHVSSVMRFITMSYVVISTLPSFQPPTKKQGI